MNSTHNTYNTQNSTYNAYTPPSTFLFTGSIVDFPRKEYSRSFPLYVTSSYDSSEYKSYQAGLYFLGCLFIGIAFIWYFVLLWLKINSETVGCASGTQFKKPSTKQIIENGNNSTKVNESDDTSDVTNIDLNNSTIPAHFSTSHSSEIGMTVYDPSIIDTPEETSNKVTNNSTLTMGKREKRTRIVFIFFGLAILCIIPFIFFYSYKPLMNTKDGSGVYLDDTKTIVDELNAVIPKILLESNNSIELITNSSHLFQDICPNSSAEDIKAQLGLDISGMITAFNVTHRRLIKYATTNNATDIIRIASYLEDIVIYVESTYDTADDYLWILPSFLVMLGALVCTTLYGAALAWKRTSTRDMQNFLSNILLPFLIISSICLWIIVSMLAVATATGNDACLGETSLGQPNDTIAEIMELSGFLKNSSTYKTFNSYTAGCLEDDPTKSIVDIANQVDIITGLIWKYLSSIDAIGDPNLDIFCGGQHALKDFVSAARELAQYLTNLKDALDSAIETLSCERVYQIYHALAEQSACTDATNAVSWGFVFFLMLAISTMVLITLRASWLHDILEEKIYDESEVDENMIVDEHEEYLAYISKYKHEWDEYQGLDTEIPISGAAGAEATDELLTFPSDTSHTESQSARWDENDASASQYPNSSQEFLESSSVSTQELFDPYRLSDSQSQCTQRSGEISFLSLSDMPSSPVQKSLFDQKESSFKKFARILPPLLINPASFEGGEDEGEVAFRAPFHGGHNPPSSSPSYDKNNGTDFYGTEDRSLCESICEMDGVQKLNSPMSQSSIDSEMGNYRQQTNIISAANRVNYAVDDTNVHFSKTMGILSTTVMPKSTTIDTSANKVHFMVEENEPHPSSVRQHVVKFSKIASASPTRPATPQRQQASKMKELTAKFDSRNSNRRTSSFNFSIS